MDCMHALTFISACLINIFFFNSKGFVIFFRPCAVCVIEWEVSVLPWISEDIYPLKVIIKIHLKTRKQHNSRYRVSQSSTNFVTFSCYYKVYIKNMSGYIFSKIYIFSWKFATASQANRWKAISIAWIR